jgi:hypothetical protein
MLEAEFLKVLPDDLGVPYEYFRVPLWPHSMDMAKRVNDFSQKKMEAFFDRYL